MWADVAAAQETIRQAQTAGELALIVALEVRSKGGNRKTVLERAAAKLRRKGYDDHTEVPGEDVVEALKEQLPASCESERQCLLEAADGLLDAALVTIEESERLKQLIVAGGVK